jgi:hypothetical protein
LLRAIVAGTATAGRSVRLGFAALLWPLAAEAAEPSTPYAVRVEGSLPVQYLASSSATAQQKSISYAPFLGMTATALIAPDVTTSLFANGGHDPPGRFRDADSTFASVGANVVKRWGAFSAGLSFEHTYYYGGTFETLNNVANDFNIFARYEWRPNGDLLIRPETSVSARYDETLAIERYSYNLRVEIEQRLVDSLWLVARPRMRFSDYVGSEAGRHDVSLSFVSGIKYVINPNVSFVTLGGVEHRNSNVASRNRDRYVVGASLDFNFNVLGSR